jgi:hypothetical protein
MIKTACILVTCSGASRTMSTESTGESYSPGRTGRSVAPKPPRRFRWRRELSGSARRLTSSEQASLAWRNIARGSKPGEARGLLRAWPGWEHLAKRLWPVSEIPGARYRLLCLRIGRYEGETVVLPDGTTVDCGAVVAQLHCNNDAILQLVRERGNPFAACREELANLTRWIECDDPGRHIVAVCGRTILTTAASRLGFTIANKPVTLRRRLERFFFKGLLLLYNQQGFSRIFQGSTASIYPSDVWLSRAELIKRYSKPACAEPSPESFGKSSETQRGTV